LLRRLDFKLYYLYLESATTDSTAVNRGHVIACLARFSPNALAKRPNIDGQTGTGLDSSQHNAESQVPRFCDLIHVLTIRDPNFLLNGQRT